MNVLAADESGSPTSRTGYGVVSIELLDKNDHPPVFDTCCLHGYVREGSTLGRHYLLKLCCWRIGHRPRFERWGDRRVGKVQFQFLPRDAWA